MIISFQQNMIFRIQIEWMSDSFAWFFSYCYTDIIKLFMLLQTMTSHVHTISAFNCYSNDIQSVSFLILLIKNKYRWFFFLLEKCIHDNFIIILSTFCYINVLWTTFQHTLLFKWDEKKCHDKPFHSNKAFGN